MSLEKYTAKRDFTKTTEPAAGKSKDKSKLMFVIQKHDATRLHYDFRLEMDGVLKSWAVPKGPSTNPEDKRLAMMVEDHPFDYRQFEGIIPKGEYGGGTVIVWDEGTYEPIEPITGKKAQEKHLLAQLKSGSVKIKLHGKKLKGEFALVKTKGMGDNAWLLIKHKDDFASAKDIIKKDKSVLSGKTIAAIEKTSDKIWKDGRAQKIKPTTATAKSASPGKGIAPAKSAKPKKSTTAEQTTASKKSSHSKKKAPINKAAEMATAIPAVETLLAQAPKNKMPSGITPMLATLVDKPFEEEGWIFEVKWDGYRCLAFINAGKVQLLSRNNKSFDDKFYPVHQQLAKWKINAVVDGEVLVLNNDGISNFGDLQNWRSEADGELVYYIFDLLWYQGKNLMNLTLRERKAILKEVLPVDEDGIRISQAYETSGLEFFDAAKQMGLEGIIAKKADSTYTPNNRSKEWLKIKVQKRQEVVIAGYTKNKDTSKYFSSLLLGVYNKGKLQYAGKVGTGFSIADQKEMLTTFKPLIIKKSPFEIVPDINKQSRFQHGPLNAAATWLKPVLVCEVAFTEVTSDGVFRHPSFQGMRIDKKATDVVQEVAKQTATTIKQQKNDNTLTKIVKPPKTSERKTLLNPTEDTQVRKINGHELKFTHLSKVYWPKDKVTKRDMFNYYYQVAEYILPYLKDRPLSLNRFPGGINSKSFYQKDIKGKAPEWITKTFPYTTSDKEKKEYLVGDDEAVLLWAASLGCIEMNPWFSRVQSPDNPDYCVIDLDPDKNTFDQVVEAALAVKNIADKLGIPCFCKTSGSTGMHIYIPLGAKYSFDQSQMFARFIVNIVHEQLPGFTSLERVISHRKGKMYLDFLQNRPGATIAGPYSLRPRPGATVSMPLHWDEVKPGLKMQDFNIHTATDRLKVEGDLFKGVLGKGIDLDKTLDKAAAIF